MNYVKNAKLRFIADIHKNKNLWIAFVNPIVNQNFQIRLTAKK
jgi:hypothetical protein